MKPPMQSYAPPGVWWDDYLKSYDMKTKVDNPVTSTDYNTLLENLNESMSTSTTSKEDNKIPTHIPPKNRPCIVQ